MPAIYSLDDVAQRLHKSRRWLQNFLRGRPIGRLAGRTRLFTDSDVVLLIQELPCPSSSGRRARVKRRAITSGAPTSASTLKRGTWHWPARNRHGTASSARNEYDIERGAVARPGEPTFAEAAINYMTAGGEQRRFLTPLIHHFGTMALSTVDQAAIDRAAAVIYPDGDAATRNRQIYTPVSAVLKRAGIEQKIKRPIGWRGRRRTDWLAPKQAFAIFKATHKIKAPRDTRTEFKILLRLLCYTGMRLGRRARDHVQ